jgi:MFS family permease
VAYSLSPGKGAALASAPLASFAGSPYAGSYADRFLRRVKVRLLAVSLGIFAITPDGSMMPVAIGSIVDGLKTQVAFVQTAMALHSLVMAAT